MSLTSTAPLKFSTGVNSTPLSDERTAFTDPPESLLPVESMNDGLEEGRGNTDDKLRDWGFVWEDSALLVS